MDNGLTTIVRTATHIKVRSFPFAVPFDRDQALTECRNFERIAKIHLKRCDCPDTAKEISMILANLAEGFAKK